MAHRAWLVSCAVALAAALGSGCASGSKSDAPVVTVAVSPHATSVPVNGTRTFTATVTGATSTAVTWSVEPAGCGTVTQAGAYTAPPVPASCQVRARSVADGTRSDAATVTVTSTVSVSPHAISVPVSGTQTFTATVNGTASTAVTWTVDPAGCGTVTQAGVYTAPPAPASCLVRARSTADPAQSDAALVTVTSVPGGSGNAYHVGEGQAFASIGAVPWYALQAGDTVYIHYRPTLGPYHEKFLVSGQGTPTNWIRVLGVPGPHGELPVISGDGATTSTNMHYRWQAASGSSAIQWDGIIQIAPRADPSDSLLPAYVEIAGLQVQNGYSSYSFTAENGTTSPYDSFAACIYARSVKHLVVRDNVLSDCGQGFYIWNGDGSQGGGTWWDGTSADLVIRGNYFHDNGAVNDYSMHQIYSEALGTTIEGNRFGPMRTGALGSQLKDRSAGTVIRYNWITFSPKGWILDLVEPENPCGPFAASPTYRQDFVYGNVLAIHGASDDIIHWNEDHQGLTTCPGQVAGTYGRAVPSSGRLYLYDNTLAITAAAMWDPFHLVNETWGAFECPAADQNGRIVARNNVFALLPGADGTTADLQLGYCARERLDLGTNWYPAGHLRSGGTAEVTGQTNLVSTGSIAFVAPASDDYRLGAGSAALGVGTTLAPIPLTGNALGVDLTPNRQYVFPHSLPTPTLQPRTLSGAGSDLGAFGR